MAAIPDRLFGSLVAILLLFGCDKPRPTVESLVAHFDSSAAGYAQIVEMLSQDSLVGTIGDGFLFTTDRPYQDVGVASLGITETRLAEYRTALEALHVKRLDRDKHDFVQFSHWGAGFGGNTHHMGIVWMRVTPGSTSGRHFTHIRDNWYAYSD